MVHKKLYWEINGGGAPEDLELWQFEMEKGTQTGETKWIKEWMENKII